MLPAHCLICWKIVLIKEYKNYIFLTAIFSIGITAANAWLKLLINKKIVYRISAVPSQFHNLWLQQIYNMNFDWKINVQNALLIIFNRTIILSSIVVYFMLNVSIYYIYYMIWYDPWVISPFQNYKNYKAIRVDKTRIRTSDRDTFHFSNTCTACNIRTIQL